MLHLDHNNQTQPTQHPKAIKANKRLKTKELKESKTYESKR